jgi:hypothetical protein
MRSANGYVSWLMVKWMRTSTPSKSYQDKKIYESSEPIAHIAPIRRVCSNQTQSKCPIREMVWGRLWCKDGFEHCPLKEDPA